MLLRNPFFFISMSLECEIKSVHRNYKNIELRLSRLLCDLAMATGWTLMC